MVCTTPTTTTTIFAATATVTEAPTAAVTEPPGAAPATSFAAGQTASLCGKHRKHPQPSQ